MGNMQNVDNGHSLLVITTAKDLPDLPFAFSHLGLLGSGLAVAILTSRVRP